MFMVSDAEIAAVMAALRNGGEFAATQEARRMWPALGVEQARECVRTITTWKPRAEPQEKCTPSIALDPARGHWLPRRSWTVNPDKDQGMHP